MRLKLVIITSLLAAIAGAGASVAIILLGFSALPTMRPPGLLLLATLLLPVVAVLLGSIFVYRHTARRRKLQAFLTALLATFLSICVFLAASILSARRNQVQPPQPVGPSAQN
jgi:hypothetical protein